MSKIEWTGKTWNPVTGCSKISAGCRECYAMRMAYRLMHIPHIAAKYAGTAMRTARGDINWTGKINLLEDQLLEPLRNKKPTVYFVNSMSDLFQENVPFSFIQKVFTVMALCPQHTFQVLTKRSKRMLEYFQQYGETGLGDDNQMDAASFPFLELIHDSHGKLLPHISRIGWFWDKHADGESKLIYEDEAPLPNVWLGVSVEDQQQIHRVYDLLLAPAAIRFLSCEPLLGLIDLELEWGAYESGNKSHLRKKIIDGINWVIAGGESGRKARPMHPDWALSLKDQCVAAGVPFFFKQNGEYRKVAPGQTGGFYKPNTVHRFDDGTEVIKVGKKSAGRLLGGKEWNQMPVLSAKPPQTVHIPF